MNLKRPVSGTLLKQVTITAMAVSGILAGCSSPLVYSSMWQSKPVTIDGKANEWKIPLDYYDEKSKLNFSISNDGTNLYFCIRATETETQKGIIRNGLQIFIDTTGGKKKEMGIQFPIIQRRGEAKDASAEKEPMQDPSTAVYGLHKQYSTATKQMKITGFPGGINGTADLPNMYGINAYLNWDTNKIMIYEACVPIKDLYKSAMAKPDTTKVLGISFVVSVTGKSYGGGGDQGGGGPGNMGTPQGMGAAGGGGGGMHGGGGGGGRHGGGGGGGGASTESLIAFIKLRLVTGPGHM
jgi:hypothetical protein